MTGPEHYREAERLLRNVDAASASEIGDHPDVVALAIAEAQVHATLALAAATAYPAVKDREPSGAVAEDAAAWAAVTA